MSEAQETARALIGLSGLAAMRALIAGEFPPPSIAATLGFALAEVEDGRAVFVGNPTEARAQSVGHRARRMGIDADRQLHGLRGAYDFAGRCKLHKCGNQSELRPRHPG